MNKRILLLLFLLMFSIILAQNDENESKSNISINKDTVRKLKVENSLLDESYAKVSPSDSSMKNFRGDTISVFLKENEKLRVKVNTYNESLVGIEDKTFNSKSKIIFRMYNERNELVHAGVLMEKRILRPYLTLSFFVINYIILEIENLSEENKEIKITYL